MQVVRRMHVSAVLGAAAVVVTGALAAQNPPAAGQPAAAGTRAPRPTLAQMVGGGTAQYLAENPQALQLAPIQVQRLRKVAARVDSANTPLRTQMEQLTGGRPLRDLPPADQRPRP